MKVDLKFVNKYCDLTKSDIYLSDVVETINGYADEDKEVWTDIIVLSGETCSIAVNIGKDSLKRITELYKMSSYIPEDILKECETDGRKLNYRDQCYKENKFAKRDYKVIIIDRQSTPSGKQVNYRIYCEQ
jgi:hypothetical protein